MEISDEMRRDLIEVLNTFIKVVEDIGKGASKLASARDLKWRLENKRCQ
jgi:hypothetical protein